jgi:outer membrane protein assembly factor BamB
MNKPVILSAILVLCMLQARSQFPQIKWWFDTHDASFGQSAAGDIDRDGKPEIVFGCYRNDSSVYALNGEDGSLLWKYNTHPAGAEGCNDVAPVLYDIDGDDSLEVIVPSSCNPKTFCFRGLNGKVQWQTPTAGSDSPPTVADIDGDGRPEILHGGFDGAVICINGENGSVAWKKTVWSNSWVQTAPTILDADNDGNLDFIVGTWAFGGDTSKVYAYRTSDRSLIWSVPVGDVIYHGTAVSDLDDDGKPELAVGAYDGKLYVLNAEDGSLVWDYQGDYYIGAPATVADLDNDGSCEVVFCDVYGVGALTSAGGLKWYYPIPGFGNTFRGVAVAEINGDGIPDVAFGTNTGRVIVLSGDDGSVIWSLDLAAHYGKAFEIDHAPVIADFDGDGTLDIFLVGGHAEYPAIQNNYGRGYMISAGTGNGPDWLMFQHDVRRQSSLCGAPVTAISEITGNGKGSLNIYPNPAENILTIHSLQPAEVMIMDLAGRRVLAIPFPVSKTDADISKLSVGAYVVRSVTSEGSEVRTFFKR